MLARTNNVLTVQANEPSHYSGLTLSSQRPAETNGRGYAAMTACCTTSSATRAVLPSLHPLGTSWTLS